MKASDYDKSRFLRGEDLAAEKKFKIKTVTEETVGQGQDKQQKLVVWFTNDNRGLPLNKTNNRTLRTAFGDDCDGWPNKIIVIYPTTAEMRGKMVPALRVKLPPPKTAAQPAQPTPAPKPEPKPEPKPAAADPDLDDDLEKLPFDEDDEEDF